MGVTLPFDTDMRACAENSQQFGTEQKGIRRMYGKSCASRNFLRRYFSMNEKEIILENYEEK